MIIVLQRRIPLFKKNASSLEESFLCSTYTLLASDIMLITLDNNNLIIHSSTFTRLVAP